MVGTLIFFNEHIIVKKYQSNKKANKKATKYIYIKRKLSNSCPKWLIQKTNGKDDEQ